jgi:division protein CdvB (Snf7/Vps24/ESCRT-III family)
MVNAKEFWMKEGEKKGEKKWEKIGEKIGLQKGIDEMIVLMREMNFSLEDIIDRLQKRFQLSRREAMRQAKKAMS